MLFVEVNKDGAPISAPINFQELRKKFPSISLPIDPSEEQLAKYNYVSMPEPEYKNIPPAGMVWKVGIPKIVNGVLEHQFELVPMSKQEKMFRINELRTRRNKLLLESDWSQLPDVQETMTDLEKKAWIKYRQALRDLPKTTENLKDIRWPSKPPRAS